MRVRCIKRVIYEGRYYNLGWVGDITGSPPAEFFTPTTDEITAGSASAYSDLDGTYYFGKNIIGWDDLTFEATPTRQGALSKPDFDFTNLGLLFPQNDPTEIAYFLPQFKHSMVEGALIHPHLHYVQDEAEIPVFKMDYRVYKFGGDPTVEFTTLVSEAPILAYASGAQQNIIPFPWVDLSNYTGLGVMMDVKIYRDDNVVAGDVLVKEFDIHYPIDSIGSGREYEK